MKEKFIKFMEGRYGVDGFARFTMGVALVCIVASVFFRNGSTTGAILNTVGLAAIIYTYFRMLSRNIQKRYAENQKYLSMTAKIRQWFRKEKNMMDNFCSFTKNTTFAFALQRYKNLRKRGPIAQLVSST
jgi:nicotinic acid phosphoribosyltransferase